MVCNGWIVREQEIGRRLGMQNSIRWMLYYMNSNAATVAAAAAATQCSARVIMSCHYMTIYVYMKLNETIILLSGARVCLRLYICTYMWVIYDLHHARSFNYYRRPGRIDETTSVARGKDGVIKYSISNRRALFKSCNVYYYKLPEYILIYLMVVKNFNIFFWQLYF